MSILLTALFWMLLGVAVGAFILDWKELREDYPTKKYRAIAGGAFVAALIVGAIAFT